MQLSINRWFNKDKEHAQYFALDDHLEVRFVNDIDRSKYSVIKSFRDKMLKVSFIICVNKKLNNIGNDSVSKFHEKFKSVKINHVPMLKSQLQKCIRRQYKSRAIKTGFNLLFSDQHQFLRRLLIIMLEDVYLHESFILIIWLMCAVPHWNLSIIQGKYLLGIIGYLCDCEKMDKVKTEYNKNKYIEIMNEKIFKVFGKEKDMLYSLHIRSINGGLKGDVKMCRYFVNKLSLIHI